MTTFIWIADEKECGEGTVGTPKPKPLERVNFVKGCAMFCNENTKKEDSSWFTYGSDDPNEADECYNSLLSVLGLSKNMCNCYCENKTDNGQCKFPLKNKPGYRLYRTLTEKNKSRCEDKLISDWKNVKQITDYPELIVDSKNNNGQLVKKDFCAGFCLETPKCAFYTIGSSCRLFGSPKNPTKDVFFQSCHKMCNTPFVQCCSGYYRIDDGTCKPWKKCKNGEYISQEGTEIFDRHCDDRTPFIKDSSLSWSTYFVIAIVIILVLATAFYLVFRGRFHRHAKKVNHNIFVKSRTDRVVDVAADDLANPSPPPDQLAAPFDAGGSGGNTPKSNKRRKSQNRFVDVADNQANPSPPTDQCAAPFDNAAYRNTPMSYE